MAADGVLSAKPRHAGCGLIPFPRLSAHARDDVTVVSLAAELDLSGTAVAQAQLRDARWQAPPRSVADLAGLPVPGRVFLSVPVSGGKPFRGRAGNLARVDHSPHAGWPVIGVLTWLEAHDTAGHAVTATRATQRFGPEYDRVAGARDSKLKADSELAERERRVRDLDIQPLTDAARASYAVQWADVQERFVDAPADAVAGAQLLVTAVMTDRGYPTGHQDQVLADLSVEHSDTLGHYRAAEEISGSAAAGTASTEDLRLAMIHYRALFGDLLGEPADAGREPAATEPGQVIAVDGTTPGDGDAYAAAARAEAAGDPVAARQHFNGSDAQELTK
jgi:hypothetical protein